MSLVLSLVMSLNMSMRIDLLSLTFVSRGGRGAVKLDSPSKVLFFLFKTYKEIK